MKNDAMANAKARVPATNPSGTARIISTIGLISLR